MLAFRRADVAEATALTALALRSKRVWGYGEEFMAAVEPDMIVRPEYLRDEYGIVAVENGAIVGYAIVRLERDAAFLRDLFVEPDRLREGIGKALFAQAAQFAVAHGAQRLRLGGDPNAVGFYERLGMVKVGEEPSIVGGGRMLPIMELNLGIRQMTREDLASVKAIDHTAFPSEERYGDEMYELMLQSGRSKVALHEGSVIGYAFVQYNPYAHIRSLAIHNEYRRCGHAKALLSAVIQEAEHEVDLLVDEANEPAVTLYESFGFERAEACQIVPPKRRMVLKLRC